MEIVLILLLVGLYLFPSLIAWHRRHHQSVAIFVLNLLLGWTLLFWVLALVWSFSRVLHPIEVMYRNDIEQYSRKLNESKRQS